MIASVIIAMAIARIFALVKGIVIVIEVVLLSNSTRTNSSTST